MSSESFVAVDLGATSGRVVLGQVRGGVVSAREVHRFPNEPLGLGRGRHWDVERLFAETVLGLRRAAAEADGDLSGVGVTAWGVDVGLVDAAGTLLQPVEHYRSASLRVGDEWTRRLGAQRLFRRTGVLPQHINTVFRLPEAVDRARRAAGDGVTALLVPDLWCALLTGQRGAERSIASTTGLLSIATRDWDAELLADIGIDRGVLPDVVPSGSVAGPLTPSLRASTGIGADVPFVRVASHDTASAVAVVSGRPRTAFLSCGTWSLIGVVRAEPVVGQAARSAGFTNETGLDDATLFMRNLTGLWLLEECVRGWREAGMPVTMEGLLRAADALGPTRSVVDVTSPELVSSDDPLHTIRRMAADSGVDVPTTPAEVTRCILQSLALAYRRTILLVEELTGVPVEAVHMIGGGSHNVLLRSLTTQACGRPLAYGPAEATALGSVMVQALATGRFTDVTQARDASLAGAGVRTEEPSAGTDDDDYWDRLDRSAPEWTETS